jgi:hypothetical protein
LLFNQVVTQGAAAAARVSETGEEAFRLPNGELMTAERFMERTRILTQTRSSLEKSEGRLNTAMDDIARVEKDKEALVNECKRCVDYAFSWLEHADQQQAQVRVPPYPIREAQAV